MASAPPWQAERIERRLVADLVPYARNSRTHSPDQIRQIANSIEHFGWTVPILVEPGGGIIAGHARVLAAQRLKMEVVPAIVAPDYWTEQDKAAYVLADNKLTENGGWDEALLKIELSDLHNSAYDLRLSGFSAEEIAALMAVKIDGQTDPDEIPENKVGRVSSPSDLWLLGQHRLACGSSTEAGVVGAPLGGAPPPKGGPPPPGGGGPQLGAAPRPHLMVTDPPYGVDYQPAWRDEHFEPGRGSGRAKFRVLGDSTADWRECWSLFDGDVAYVWSSPLTASTVEASLVSSGFEVRSHIIWNKSQFVVSRSHYHSKHECLFYAVREDRKSHWCGDHKQTTVWDIDKARRNETGHSAQKPVECMRRPIENNSLPGEGVYDPFVGSGTTIIAGEITGRPVFACEINPAYVDIAVLRWQEFTGKEAILEKTGQSFTECAADRLAA